MASPTRTNNASIPRTQSFEQELKETGDEIPADNSTSLASHMYQYFWTNSPNTTSKSSKQMEQNQQWLRREQAKGLKMMTRVLSLTKDDTTLPEGIAQLNSCPPPSRKHPHFLLSGYLAVKTTTSWTSRWTCRYVVLTPHFLYVFKRLPPTPGQHAHAQVAQVLNQSTPSTGSALGINQSVSLANDLYVSHPSHEQHSSLEIFGEIRDKIPIDSSLAVIDSGNLFFQLSHPNNLRLVFRALNPRHTAIWKGAIRTASILCNHSIQTLLGALPQAVAMQQQQIAQASQTKQRKSVTASPSNVASQSAPQSPTTPPAPESLQSILADPAFGIIPHVNRLIPAYTDRSSLISSVSMNLGQIPSSELGTAGLLASPLTLVTSQNRDPNMLYPEVILERNINWGEEIIIPIPQPLIDRFNRSASAAPSPAAHTITMTMQDGGSVTLDLAALYSRAIAAAASHAKGSSSERNMTVNSAFSFADATFPLENSFYDADVHTAWRFVAGKPKEENTVAPVVTSAPTSPVKKTSAVATNDPTASVPVMFKHVKKTGNMLKSELSFAGLFIMISGITFALALSQTLGDSLLSYEELCPQLSDALSVSYQSALNELALPAVYLIGSLLAGITVIFGASQMIQVVLNPYAKRQNKYVPQAGTFLAASADQAVNTSVSAVAQSPSYSNAKDWKENRVSLTSLSHLRLLFVRLVDTQSPSGPILLNGVPFENTSWPVLPSPDISTVTSISHGGVEDASVESVTVSGSAVVRHSLPVRRRRVQITDLTFGDSAALDLSQYVDQEEPIDEIFPGEFSDSEDEEDVEEEMTLDRFNSSSPAVGQDPALQDDSTTYEQDPMLGRIVPSIWGKWCQSSHDAIKLRGPDYLSNKKKIKIAANQHHFEAAFCNIIAVINSFTHASSQPDSYFVKEKNIMAARGLGSLWGPGTPLKFLCVNWIVPGEPNYNFVSYFRNPYIFPWPFSDAPSTPHAIKVQKDIKEAIAAGEEAVQAKYNVSGNEHCKVYYPKDDPFFTLMDKFVNGTDEFRTSRFKYIPNIVVGSWVVKKGVGQTPVILGNKLAQRYYEDDDKQYVEVEIDVSTSSVAGSVLKLVKSSAKSLEIDMHFLLEPHHDDELPEALWGGIRIKNVDLFNIPTTYYDND